MKNCFNLSVLTAILLSVISCKGRPVAPVSKTEEAMVVAKVGDSVITDKMLMNRVTAIEKSFPKVYSTHPQKKKLLEEMANVELLYQEAMRQHLNERYEFKSRLADLFVQNLSDEARQTIPDEKVKEFFEANKHRYEQISARHILVKSPSNDFKKHREEARQKIQKIYEEVKKNPGDFAEIARKNSEDGTASAGGELGYFSYEMMVPEFSKAAFDLKKIDEVSPIVQSQYGFHIIQLSGDRRSFDNYKEQVRDQMARASQKDRLDAELARLKEKSPVTIYEENLLKLSPLPEGISKDPDLVLPKQLNLPGSKKD